MAVSMEVRYSKTAQTAMLRSNKRALIRDKIAALADNPDELGPNVIRLQGRSDYRLRVQDWRVIFRIDGEILYVDDIAPRGSAYEVKR
jgi:mRNA interferase RelE/StbE